MYMNLTCEQMLMCQKHEVPDHRQQMHQEASPPLSQYQSQQGIHRYPGSSHEHQT